MSSSLLYPEKIVFGENSVEELPALLPSGAKILLVCGNSAVKSKLKDRVCSLLGNFDLIDCSGRIVPEPPLECVDALIESGRENDVNAVVSLGGGSVIDAGKAAAAVISAEGSVADYFYGHRKVEAKGLFFAALTTTAGTGAEITRNSVLTDPASMLKKSIRSPFMIPDVAIVDPVLTAGMPPSLTAASGLDAFVQALESFTSSGANAVTEALAKEAVGIIFANLADAYMRGGDSSARKSMAEGSLMSAMAFSQSGLGAVHGLAHPVGSLLSVPHGVACSILLRPVMKFNMPKCVAKYAELARSCYSMNPELFSLPVADGDSDLAAAEKFIDAVGNLCSELDIADDFSAYGLNESHFGFITENCRGGSMNYNPRSMSDDEIKVLLSELI